MSNWREWLIEGAKAPEQQKQEAKQKLEAETRRFYETEVVPAFEALKEILKKQGKQVDTHIQIHDSRSSIIIHSQEVPNVPEFNYIITVEDGRTRVFISYLPKDSKNYTDKESNIKPEALIHSVFQDDICDNFTNEYNKVRHQI